MRNRGAGGHRTGFFCWRESSKPGVMISSSTRIAFPPLRRGHQFVNQRPLKAGFLFSANAFTRQPDPSSSTQPHKPHSPPPLPSLTHSRSSSPAPGQSARLHRPLAKSRLTCKTLARAVPSSFSSSGVISTSRSHRPMKYASWPLTLRPVRIISRARFTPTRRERRHVPPTPATIASRISGWLTMAVEPKTRKDVHRPSSRPPPRAREQMAEMVGMGRVERLVRVSRRWARKNFVSSWVNVFRS
jgi:hypothetical protein